MSGGRRVNAPAPSFLSFLLLICLLLYFFCQRIGKLVVVPEAVVLLRNFYTFPDEFLTVGVLCGNLIRADQFFIGAMGKYVAI